MKKAQKHIKKVFSFSKKTKEKLKTRAMEFIHTFIKITRRPDMRILPGNLAFFLILSIPPLLTLLGLFCSLFSSHLIELIENLGGILPKEIQSIFFYFLTANQSTGTTFIYLLIGFLMASNGAHSIIVLENTLYEVDCHTFIKRRIKSFLFTVLLLLLFLFSLIFVVYGNRILKSILSLSVFSHVYPTIYPAFLMLKWPIAFLVAFFLVKFIYRFALDIHLPRRRTSYGALFTTLGIGLVTSIYSYYVNHLAHYDIFYGSLSNLIVLMVWIYFVSYIFTCGIAINISHYGKNIE